MGFGTGVEDAHFLSAAQDPIGVDIARDDLSFYPLLYWPMNPA